MPTPCHRDVLRGRTDLLNVCKKQGNNMFAILSNLVQIRVSNLFLIGYHIAAATAATATTTAAASSRTTLQCLFSPSFYMLPLTLVQHWWGEEGPDCNAKVLAAQSTKPRPRQC